jgi:hypothetical protein
VSCRFAGSRRDDEEVLKNKSFLDRSLYSTVRSDHPSRQASGNHRRLLAAGCSLRISQSVGTVEATFRRAINVQHVSNISAAGSRPR